jgi:hypothetical protein
LNFGMNPEVGVLEDVLRAATTTGRLHGEKLARREAASLSSVARVTKE